MNFSFLFWFYSVFRFWRFGVSDRLVRIRSSCRGWRRSRCCCRKTLCCNLQNWWSFLSWEYYGLLLFGEIHICGLLQRRSVNIHRRIVRSLGELKIWWWRELSAGLELLFWGSFCVSFRSIGEIGWFDRGLLLRGGVFLLVFWPVALRVGCWVWRSLLYLHQYRSVRW